MAELRRVLAIAVLAIAVLGLWPWPAASLAEPPAAGMVVTLIGTTTPGLADGDEIPTGITVQIAPTATLTFLHYAKCKLVTITGGSVTLSPTDYRASGTIESEKNGPCPRVHQLSGTAAGATSGALIMRGMAAAIRLSTAPEFIFAGSRAGKVTGASIYTDGDPGRLVARLGVVNRRAILPGTMPPLAVNARYVLRVAVSDSAAPLELVFVGTPPAPDNTLAVLRVD